MPICERAGRLERAAGPPRRPPSTRVGLTATLPSTLLESGGGGRGRRGLPGEAALGGRWARWLACRVPATGPALSRLCRHRARPSRHTSSRAFRKQHRGGGGGGGTVHGRRGGEAGDGSLVGNGGCGQGPRSFTARLDHSRFQWWRPARRTYTELSLVDHSGGSPHQWGAWLAAHKQNLGRKPRRSTPLPPASLLLPAGETTWLRPPPYSHRQRNRGDTPPSGARSYHRRPRCRRCRRRRCSRRHNRSGTPLLGTAGVVPPPHRLGRGTRRAGARTACGPCGTRRRAAVPEQARDQ